MCHIYIYIYIYNQGLLGRVLGGGRAHPTECHPFGEVPWTLQILVLPRLLPRFPLRTQKSGKLPPQGTPKWPQSHSDTCGRTLQNTWYLQCGSHIGPLRRELDHPLCFCVFPGAYFFRFPVTFADWGFKFGPKMECSFLPHELQVASFLDKAPTSGHSGALEKSRGQKLMPNGASGNSKTAPNRGSGRSI